MSHSPVTVPSPGSVMAIRRHFESLHKMQTGSQEPVSQSLDREDDIHITAPAKTSHANSPRSASPSHVTPARMKPNTYQSSAISQFRNKYTNHRTGGAVTATVSPLSVPVKPPRTFAHDIYVQEKEEIRVLVDQKYRRSAANGAGNGRRRSRSAESVAWDHAIRRVSPLPAYSAITEIFDLSSPVESIIRKSFGPADEVSAFCDAVDGSAADGDDAVCYARTLRLGLRGRTISHYSTISNRTAREAYICKYVTVYDRDSDSVTIHPLPSDSRKADFVKKFCKSFENKGDDCFYWFAFTEQSFFYTYFLSHESRVVSVSSDLYSPHFFSALLEAIVCQSRHFPDRRLIDELVSKHVPIPGEVVSVGQRDILVPWQLPQVTAAKQSVLLVHMEPDVIIMCVATLVQERRLAFVSRHSHLLLESSKALLSLLYPLAWDYMFWPHVPDDLVTLCAALTLPFFVCLRPEQCLSFQTALKRRNQKVLIVDLDTRRVVTETGDERKILPKSYFQSVRTALHLSRNMTDPTASLRDKLMRDCFLEVFVQLLGPVTSHVVDGNFCKSAFLKGAIGRTYRSFFLWFLETRLFENFVKYFQIRAIHSKYIPASTKVLHMDLFERKTEPMRQTHQKRTAKQGRETNSTIGWSATAIRVVENRFTAIGHKIMKHM